LILSRCPNRTRAQQSGRNLVRSRPSWMLPCRVPVQPGNGFSFPCEPRHLWRAVGIVSKHGSQNRGTPPPGPYARGWASS
jgi:hypothetical protein